ncbi:cupin domain-containing protein [Phormidesmis priestleyi]
MKRNKLFVYVCCLVVGMASFFLVRSSALNAQEPLPLQSNIGTSTKIEFVQPNLLSKAELSESDNSSILNQPSLIAASVDSNEIIKFACEPRQVDVHNYSGGVVSYCKKKDFTIAENDSARVDIKPGAARAPHWHNTWEEQVLISGKAKTFVIDNKGQVHEEVMQPGMVSFLPAGLTHWSEAVGNETASFLFIFPAGFKTFELSDSIANLNPKVMKSIMGVQLAKIKQNRDAVLMIDK